MVASATAFATATASIPASTPAGGLTHYYGEGSADYAQGSGQAFAFDYPSSWEVIGGFHEVYTHGPTVMVAVGIGDYDINCGGSLPGAVNCGDPVWTVPDDGVVLVYRLQEWPQGPIAPYPTPEVGPADKWVQIDGRTALFSQGTGRSMSWSLLGTPEIIEVRFGSAVADTAPQQIQAVIDSWQWSAPIPTARPSPITAGSGSATYSWQNVASAQAGVFPFWAPDSNHLIVVTQNANEYDGMELLDRAGNSLATATGLETYPFWLNSSVVEGYEATSMPGYAARFQYHMAPGRSFAVSDPTPASVVLPCCDPISNGEGAIATTRYLPDRVPNLIRPKFVVWQDGVESAEHDGAPVAWDLAGDKLLVIHPTQPEVHGIPDGWLEVLSWPSLTSVFQDDPNNAVSEAGFDPSGRYVSYTYVYPDASNAWHMEIHIVDLNSGTTTRIPLAGDSSEMNVGDYVWNNQGQVLVASNVDMTLSTYLPDGTVVNTTDLAHPTSLQASANGETILTSNWETDNPSDLRVFRNGVSRPVWVPGDWVDSYSLSPDGSQLFVSGNSPSDDDVAGYLADIP